MTPKQFQKYLDRDGGCVHCGEIEAVSPNHRSNRGMGGSKLLDRPSNVIVLCSSMNSLIESSASSAALALSYGWKLYRWETPEAKPFYDAVKGRWFILDNDFNRFDWTDAVDTSIVNT